MKILGYEDKMVDLLEKMKLRGFVELHDITSPSLTLEFMSTLKLNKDNSLSFRLCNHDKTLSLDQLGEALRLSIIGHCAYKDEPLFDEHKAWLDLTGENKFKPKIARDSSIASFVMDECSSIQIFCKTFVECGHWQHRKN